MSMVDYIRKSVMEKRLYQRLELWFEYYSKNEPFFVAKEIKKRISELEFLKNSGLLTSSLEHQLEWCKKKQFELSKTL